MKKNRRKLVFSFIVVACLLSFIPAKSQNEYGLKGGILFSDINKSGPSSNQSFKRQEGLSFGAFYKRNNLFGPIGFQGEIIYQLKGAEVFIKDTGTGNFEYNTYSYTNQLAPLYYHSQEKLHYLSVPLLLTVPVTKFAEFYFGPELNYLISKDTERIDSDKLNRFTLGAAVGANLKLGENTRLDLRYTHDLNHYDNMGTTEYPIKLKSYGFAVSIQQTLFRK